MKKNFGTEPKIGYCPLSMRLGAGVGRRGRRRACRVLGAGARGWRADGRAGRAGAGRGRRRARGRRQRRVGAGAAGAGVRRFLAGRAGAWLGERACGWASGRAAGRTVRAGHGRQAARARSLCAQAGPVGCSCTRLGFQPGFFDSVFFLSH